MAKRIKIKVSGKEVATVKAPSSVTEKTSKGFKEIKLPNTKEVRDFLNKI